jgi:uncharacterized YigZ family protein
MKITIKEDFIFEEEIKKSRFICHLKRIETEEEARDFIASIKKQHHKANHNCSAFTLGDHQEIQRSSDDGEPSGTAGVPMLEVLKKRELINVCAVVTRYFGGVKLGAGGLIRAYAGSVAHAVEAVGEVKIVEQTELIAELDYSNYESFTRYLDTEGFVNQAEFSDKVLVSFFVDNARVTEVEASITEQFNGRVPMLEGDKQEVEVPL